MIINGTELLAAEPILNMETCKIESQGVSYGLGEAGYDIKLAEEIIFDAQGDYNTVSVNGIVSTGRFTLASACEKFNMPTNLIGVVHDKSTHARRGLSVLNTVIECGWCGYLTLELVFHGQGKLHLPKGTGIAQVLFHEIKEHNEYNGKYSNQAAGPQKARYA